MQRVALSLPVRSKAIRWRRIDRRWILVEKLLCEHPTLCGFLSCDGFARVIAVVSGIGDARLGRAGLRSGHRPAGNFSGNLSDSGMGSRNL